MKNNFKYLNLFATALVVLLISGCSKNKIEPDAVLNSSEVTLKYDETFKFKVKKGDKDIDFGLLTFSSSDELVGIMNNEGVFTAKKVGETTVKIMGEGVNLTAKVVVEPYQNFFIEPYQNFDGNISSIKKYEKRKLLNELSSGLIYEGENSDLKYVIYTIDKEVLSGSAAVFNPIRNVMDKVATYYLERYEFLGIDGTALYFKDSKRKFAVIIDVNTSLGFHSLYIDARSILSKKFYISEKFQNNKNQYIIDVIMSNRDNIKP